MGRDGKQVAFQRLVLVKVRQAVEEADKGLLHHVLGGHAIGRPSDDEAQQSAFIGGINSPQASASPARMRAINKVSKVLVDVPIPSA